MISNRQKKKRFVMRTLVMTLVMTLFTQFAQAQQNVYMQTVTKTVPTNGFFNFYDTGGKSSADGSYFWETWYAANENATMTFQNGDSPIQVTFKTFQAWDDDGWPDYNLNNLGNNWGIRLNDDHLYIYDGATADNSRLIADLTNNIEGEFTFMTNGPMTFKFVSTSQYQEEGWAAEVRIAQNGYALQKPIISKEECDDDIVLYNTNAGTRLYYTIDGTTPDTTSTLYTTPFHIDLDAANASVKVQAIAYTANGNTHGAVAEHTFTHADQRPTPEKPTITFEGNMVHIVPPVVPEGLNETYNVRYTTDGTMPAANNGNLITKPWAAFEWTTPNTTFIAVTVAVTCDAQVSDTVRKTFGEVKVPTPEIVFGTTYDTIKSSVPGVIITYTTNGSNPTAGTGASNVTPYPASGTAKYYYLLIDHVALGTTVKAMANNTEDGFVPSDIASAIFAGNGSGVSSNGIVFLDDREDHSWSYYSDEVQPIHSLKPIDVKITYKGFGENTMTGTSTANMPANDAFTEDVESSQVAVNVGEPGNQFIYLKTLENANADGSGNYPYTMIANPFQVRPAAAAGTVTTQTRYVRTTTITEGKKYLIVSQSNAGTAYALGRNGTTVAADQVTIVAGGTANYIETSTVDATSVWTAGSGYKFQNGNYYIRNNNNALVISTTNNNNNWDWGNNTLSYTTGSGWNSTTYYIRYNNGFTIAEGGWLTTYNVYLFEETTESTVTGGDYRGFYAWRIKSLGGGLSIDGKNVGDFVYPDEQINFVSTNAEGNEVEFEALWAKAWVNDASNHATNSGNYQNAYERNFKTTFSSETYPVTYTTLKPDGSGTVSSMSPGNVSPSADIKFENVNLSLNGLNGNNHSVHIGRGVSNGNSNVVSTVYGYNGASGNSVNAFTLRIESGRYTDVFLFNNSSSTGVGAARTWNMLFGSDYDRANNDNSKLTITGVAQISKYTYCSSSSAKINVTALSGTFGSTGNNTEVYLGFENAQTASQAKRTLEVLGGEFLGGIAGGIEGGEITSTTEVLKMRIRGGDIHQYVYGSGQHSTAYGTRKTIITGGTFDAWISGACYGTHSTSTSSDYSGKTVGNTYVYFGGDATQTNTDGIFGAGYGEDNETTDYYTVLESYVVVADDATTTGSVYGGGNNGYNKEDAEVWVLAGSKNGLTVSGSVFGGANKARSQGKTTVTMNGGTVSGSLYGGANTSGTVSGLGTVNFSGGTVSNVFGGGYGSGTNMAAGTKVNVSGGTINNNVYGGGDAGTVTGNTDVTVSGGTMKNVYGAGKGGTTTAQVSGQTFVTVTGGSIANVYGGGEAGDVVLGGGGGSGSQATVVVTLSGNTYTSTVRSITVSYTSGGSTQSKTLRWRNNYEYGANSFSVDKGTDFTITAKAGTGTGYTFTITIDGETVENTNLNALNVPKSYSIPAPSVTPTDATVASTVTVSGGEISKNVYGGGKLGKTTGATTVNVSGGNIRGNLFGGAEGEQKKVFITGRRTVNMTGGHVYGNVYGGSQNANDGNDLTLNDANFSTSNETEVISVTNISAGIIDENVYAAGYYGNTFGSVYVFIGRNAIVNSPNVESTIQPVDSLFKIGAINITDNVWAGGDWGTYSGTFGDPTVSGNSNIYIDGEGYVTQTSQSSNAQYMNIGGSVLGCGTSCDAGKKERTVIIRNYGYANSTSSKAEPFSNATRSLYSIQRAKTLILDNAHINFTGQGMVNSQSTTEKYGVYEISETMRIVNGSSIFLNAPVSHIKNFMSMKCDDVYTADLTDDYTALTPDDLSTIDNKVRVNGGNYVEVKYGTEYGELAGYAHMMVSTNDADATCAYARPKQCYTTPINTTLNNPDDGGWVSYTPSKNKFNADGSDVGTVQMPYENHTVRNGEQYFRIWRDGGIEHYREGVFKAHATGTTDFVTTDVIINLPPFHDNSYVYRFEVKGDGTNTSIDYGADVLTFNAARATGTGNDWMYYTGTAQATGQPQDTVQTTLDEIIANPDVNFGLISMKDNGLAGSNYIICSDSDKMLADTANTEYTCADNTIDPNIRFRLTYYNKLSANMTWAPMTIVLVQVDPKHPETVLERVTISLQVNTSNTIDQEFSTQVYAVMQGKGSTNETYTAKVVLPTYTGNAGHESEFAVTGVTFEPKNNGNLIERANGYTFTDFSVDFAAGYNYDNTDGWNGTGTGAHDTKPVEQAADTAVVIGYTGGRTAFAIDFTLHYNGHEKATTTDTLGTLKYTIHFDNYQGTGEKDLVINVVVIRRGQGNAFYLDGINGKNSYKGDFPDQAALELSTIFNRLGYLAGDEIYIVNKVKADKQLTWNGLSYDNVRLYRYDGGHKLSSATAQIIGNPDNTAYTGVLVEVNHSMMITGITLDGHYNDGNNTIITGYDADDQPIYSDFTPVTAAASMITVAANAKLELGNGTVLTENNSGSIEGSAVNVAEGGTLMMNSDATITKNYSTGNGAGVFMTGNMVVSDKVVVYDNMNGNVQNNVYLNGADEVITIGTPAPNDTYGPLVGEAKGDGAKIGVTKAVADDYTKVVYVDADVNWLETPYNTHPNSVIFHDLGKYQLEKYSDEHYLYWVGTWVTLQDHVPTNDEGGWPYDATTTQFDINTQYQLAWIISMVNGENGCTADDFSGKTINIKDDISMDESIWVPIGNERNPFKGTFQGNGHVIKDMHSKLVQPYMGMFGNAEDATIENTIANVDFKADATNIGTFIGTMTNTNVNNVEAAGILKGGNNTANMGGLVGNVESGTIHSSFAVNTMTAVSDNTVMGGLVGNNSSKLYNSYANVTMTGATNTKIGGLVGVNDGDIQNCYVVVSTQGFPAFAHTNNSSILYSYADKNTYVTESASDARLKDHGTYGAVLGRKAVGYMYGDNVVTPAVAADTTYIVSVINYEGNKIGTWPGLLSSLNQWVAKNDGYTSWNRPTSADINGDLPILAFDNDVCLASTDGKFLDYDTDLDHLLGLYDGQSASMYLYKSVSGVKKGTGTNKLFIQEDAALLQDQGSKAEIKATVGITFDNSCKKATDWFGNGLDYDWHLMSTPLSDAPLGINYTAGAQTGYGKPADWSEVTENSYMPTMTNSKDGVTWDFYTYYEPEYHWINFKRSKNNHWHYDEPNDNIDYTGAEQPNGNLTKGKGYMMAISQDSYLSNTGTLNTGKVEIALTRSGELPETEEYTKDWGSNLLGNPYQAYLDLEQVATTGYETFYVYIAEEDQYKPYTSGSSKNTYAPSQYLHPHQAFFVLMTEKEEDTFTFTYDMATTSSEEHSYFRKGEHIDYPLINLFVNDEKGARNYTTI